MYKPKNEILKAYLENNEAKSAKIGKDEILISVEDVDEVISRVIQNYPTRKVRVTCRHLWGFVSADERDRAIKAFDLRLRSSSL